MVTPRERFRSLLAKPECTLAANIFDPLSARIAHMLGYEVCVLSGSVGKVANLGVPDIVLSTLADVVDHCRRITRMAEVSLMVDAEDGFGNAVNVRRAVKELEAVGVAAIEIEDNVVPRQFKAPHPGLVSTEAQVGKLQAAVAARSDPSTVIVARTAALGECPLEEALDRIRAYSETGAEALMLTGARGGRRDIEAVHRVTSLPICILTSALQMPTDGEFLSENGVKILMLGNPTFAVAVKAIHDSLQHLRDGGMLEDLKERQAAPELLRAVNRTDEFIQWQDEYLRE
ncbi:MAG: oxaloacetate decarboxylase [SAR202 cluster bacterium]|nr:oxaloacetate decarboxylase [SAR202 cluster bacterium]